MTKNDNEIQGSVGNTSKTCILIKQKNLEETD
jgi:hypothetical protein